MKKNPALSGFIYALLAAVAAFAVYFFFLAKRDYFLVDNPTPQTFYFRLNNGSEKIITAGQFIKVDLKKGKNAIKVFDRNKKMLYDSTFTVGKERGLLNITHSDYYIHKQFYGYNLKRDSLLMSMNKTIIDGQEYYGEPRLMNRMYTEDFYYNVDEDYDKVIKNIQKVESRDKIFRKQDFLNYYKEYYKF